MSLTELQTSAPVQSVHSIRDIRAHKELKAATDSNQGLNGSNGIELANLAGDSESPTAEDILRLSNSEPASPTPAQKRIERIRYATLLWALFLVGWNDGSTGPLLPRIQEVYHVGYTVVSLLFIFTTVGYLSGSVANVYTVDRFGYGKVLIAGSVINIAAAAIQSPAPPFPVLVFSFFLYGFGGALQDSLASGYVATLKSGTRMSILHSLYGFGAFAAPLVATQFAQMERWSFHYLITLGIAVVNTALLSFSFRFKTLEECMAEIGKPINHTSSGSNTAEDKYRQILRSKEVNLLAFFLLVYIGVAVTLGGWTVTYVVTVRGGGPNSGYISSGFYGGLTLGRVALMWVNKKIGEKRVVYIYMLLSIGLELVIWLVPSLIGGGIAVSFVGFLFGPIYPIVMNHAGRIIPPWLLTGSIAWIAGFGQSGSAFVPFITGAIASKAGIESLQPLVVGTMGLTLILWFLVPNHSRLD